MPEINTIISDIEVSPQDPNLRRLLGDVRIRKDSVVILLRIGEASDLYMQLGNVLRMLDDEQATNTQEVSHA